MSGCSPNEDPIFRPRSENKTVRIVDHPHGPQGSFTETDDASRIKNKSHPENGMQQKYEAFPWARDGNGKTGV